MFHRGHFVLRILGTLLLIGVLVAGGAALFHAGQSQGYAMGIATAANPITAQPQTAPGAPGSAVPGPFYPRGPFGYGYGYGYPYGPHFMPFFFPFGFLGIGLFLLFLFMIGGVFRMFAFRRHMMWRHNNPEGWDGPWGHGMHHGEPGSKPANPDASKDAPKEPPTSTPQP